MGMFDYVHFEMPCPSCGEMIRNFQSKDDDCIMATIEPDGIGNFYASCHHCRQWVEFYRPKPPSHPLREKPLTREEVEAMGFVLHVRAHNAEVTGAPHHEPNKEQ